MLNSAPFFLAESYIPSHLPPSPFPEFVAGGAGAEWAGGRRRTICRLCMTGDTVERIALPYVYRYLATELASMNIRMSFAIASQ